MLILVYVFLQAPSDIAESFKNNLFLSRADSVVATIWESKEWHMGLENDYKLPNPQHMLFSPINYPIFSICPCPYTLISTDYWLPFICKYKFPLVLRANVYFAVPLDRSLILRFCDWLWLRNDRCKKGARVVKKWISNSIFSPIYVDVMNAMSCSKTLYVVASELWSKSSPGPPLTINVFQSKVDTTTGLSSNMW